MTIKRVGLIGVGLMGHGIGKNIVALGYDLLVMAHHNRVPVDDLLSRGAGERGSPRDIATDSDLVILCVTGTPQIEDLVYRRNGLLDAVRPGLVIADCSTAEPASTVRIAADVTAKGGHFVDAPMTRTPKEAEVGKLALMVGGPQDVLAEIRPVLECFADTIVYAGPVGSAHRLKLINNFVCGVQVASLAEALAMIERSGLDREAALGVLTNGAPGSIRSCHQLSAFAALTSSGSSSDRPARGDPLRRAAQGPGNPRRRPRWG